MAERKQKTLLPYTLQGQPRAQNGQTGKSASRNFVSLFSGQEDYHMLGFQALAPAFHPDNACDTICVDDVTFIGEVLSKTTYVKRDLGFQGQIGPYVLLSFGDTLYSDSTYSDAWRGMTSNSVAFATHNPLKVVDSKLDEKGYPMQFVSINELWKENTSEWAVGITNVIETTPGEGMLFYLLNHRPGPDHKDRLVGAGVARVTLDYSHYPPLPYSHRVGCYLWDGETEPWFGDVGSIKARGFIYAYGHAKDSPFVYLARVKINDWDKVECYEYWHGKDVGWRETRLKNVDLGEDQSVFWQVNQGQVVWNEYLKRFLFVYCDNFWDKTVILRHAPSPEGPWSNTIDIYKGIPITENGNIYAAVPHPYFDPTGKTLVITFTNFPNCIQAIRITFGDKPTSLDSNGNKISDGFIAGTLPCIKECCTIVMRLLHKFCGSSPGDRTV